MSQDTPVSLRNVRPGTNYESPYMLEKNGDWLSLTYGEDTKNNRDLQVLIIGKLLKIFKHIFEQAALNALTSRMEKLYSFYYFLDLAGCFAFAISGAVAARQRGLDLFGIAALAFIVSCGGGIIRDLCIGAIPPAGLKNWQYLVVALFATGLTVGLYPVVQRLKRPVLFFDSVGLSLFAVTGAQKALAYGHNGEVAILLGITTAVGGGVLRDILLNRVPVILEKEIYASAALTGAVIVVINDHFKLLPGELVSVIALVTCFTLRTLAVRYHWNLPAPEKDKTNR